VFVAALIVLLIAVLLVIAALFGADVTSTVGSTDGVVTIDLGVFDLEMDATAMFFLGMVALLLFFLSLAMFRSAAKRAAARRADRKKVSELSSKLDEYKRDERDEGRDLTRDDS
jgi:membrane protein implicated in regulation of membrane protease activity